MRNPCILPYLCGLCDLGVRNVLHCSGFQTLGISPVWGMANRSEVLYGIRVEMNTISPQPLSSRFGTRRFVSSSRWICLSGLWLALVSANRAGAEAVVYAAPSNEVLSQDYAVWVDGQPVDVYRARVLDAPFSNQWRVAKRL
jgi:hypothetical protein